MDIYLLEAFCIEAMLLLFANIFNFFKLVKLLDSFVLSALTTQRACYSRRLMIVDNGGKTYTLKIVLKIRDRRKPRMS